MNIIMQLEHFTQLVRYIKNLLPELRKARHNTLKSVSLFKLPY